MESHRAGFPPLPLLLEIPSGFPHSDRFDDGIDIKTTAKAVDRLKPSAPQGACYDVSGPQRNACPGTLTP
jgi:hypothetical protein